MLLRDTFLQRLATQYRRRWRASGGPWRTGNTLAFGRAARAPSIREILPHEHVRIAAAQDNGVFLRRNRHRASAVVEMSQILG